MNYIERSLAREIREKVERINNSSDKCIYRMLCEKIKRNLIDRNARIHSWRIENPGVVKKKLIKQGSARLKGAFELGKEKFKLPIDDYFLFHIVGKVEPEIYRRDMGYYRGDNDSVMITGSKYIPPASYKVRMREMPWFFENLNLKISNSGDDPVQQLMAAIWTHFHIVRIHPFIDGNGRTARTAQNIILDHYGFPLPIIPSTERNTYYHCLEQAVGGWRDKEANGVNNGPTEGERIFYDFMAGKVNTSLDEIVRCIH
ncbi:MAG: Fic family protein [Nanoarchaeota archaeon]